MDYSQFFNMIPEAGLMAALVIVFLADLILKGEKKHTTLSLLTGLLLVAQIAVCFTAEPAEAFAGLYTATAAAQVMKVILTAGAFIVVVMAQSWLEQKDVQNKEGEFYELIISTLLGMYMMISSGHFLMFFLGLEMASVPMACLVAFDKFKKESAEGAAKFVLTATFSSGVMLYGISFIYGACGTLYFDDVMAQITATPLTIMGLVFFFSGLGFKISLVPFHFWTADTYQGAPTAVTGYLSVVSKGAAAFALMTILTKVFAPMVEYWEMLMYIVIVLTITIANLFALRQTELKRFMAFSSISQAGCSGRQRRNGSAGADVLRAHLRSSQHGSVHHHQRCGDTRQGQHRDVCVRRLLHNQPEALVPHDTRSVLARRHPAVCRYVLQVLRVHGSSRAGF